MFRSVQNIAESIYRNYSRNHPEITYSYFPYFELIRNYENYNFHFSTIRKEYMWWTLFMTEGSLLFFELRRSRVIFFARIFTRFFRLKKNNGTEMNFLKYKSRNEMHIYCFTCRDFPRTILQWSEKTFNPEYSTYKMNSVTMVNVDEIFCYYLCNKSKQILLSDDDLTVYFVIVASLNSSELILIFENCYNFFEKLFKPEYFFEETKKCLLQTNFKKCYLKKVLVIRYLW